MIATIRCRSSPRPTACSTSPRRPRPSNSPARGAGAHRPCHRHHRLQAARRRQDRGGGAPRAIVKSGNMSLGVNLLAVLVEQAARALGRRFRHRDPRNAPQHKVDAPSGTALLLGEAAAAGRGIALAGNARARPRRPHRRAQARRYRLCHAARRLGGRRPQRDFRRHRRAHRAVPPRRGPRAFSPAAPSRPRCGRAARSRASIRCATCSASASDHLQPAYR